MVTANHFGPKSVEYSSHCYFLAKSVEYCGAFLVESDIKEAFENLLSLLS